LVIDDAAIVCEEGVCVFLLCSWQRDQNIFGVGSEKIQVVAKYTAFGRLILKKAAKCPYGEGHAAMRWRSKIKTRPAAVACCRRTLLFQGLWWDPLFGLSLFPL